MQQGKESRIVRADSNKCSYPECSKEPMVTGRLDVSNVENSTVKLPFCEYHFYVVCGGHFHCHALSDDNFMIKGPFESVSLIEQVNGAILQTTKKNVKESFK